MEAVMMKRVIAGAIILGLGAVTFALAQQGSGQVAARSSLKDASPGPSADRPAVERAELHARVARLRAEVELLQLEHDLKKEVLSAGMKGRAEGLGGERALQVARDYMRIGAELVDKGAEFEAAMQEKGDEIWKAVTKAAGTTAPADLDHLKQDFVRLATELNRKKIELVELETRLDASM
jgi:hypothetical protein